jgi:hypothetical protein
MLTMQLMRRTQKHTAKLTAHNSNLLFIRSAIHSVRHCAHTLIDNFTVCTAHIYTLTAHEVAKSANDDSVIETVMMTEVDVIADAETKGVALLLSQAMNDSVF